MMHEHAAKPVGDRIIFDHRIQSCPSSNVFLTSTDHIVLPQFAFKTASEFLPYLHSLLDETRHLRGPENSGIIVFTETPFQEHFTTNQLANLARRASKIISKQAPGWHLAVSAFVRNGSKKSPRNFANRMAITGESGEVRYYDKRILAGSDEAEIEKLFSGSGTAEERSERKGLFMEAWNERAARLRKRPFETVTLKSGLIVQLRTCKDAGILQTTGETPDVIVVSAAGLKQTKPWTALPKSTLIFSDSRANSVSYHPQAAPENGTFWPKLNRESQLDLQKKRLALHVVTSFADRPRAAKQ